MSKEEIKEAMAVENCWDGKRVYRGYTRIKRSFCKFTHYFNFINNLYAWSTLLLSSSCVGNRNQVVGKKKKRNE